jgi:cyclase
MNNPVAKLFAAVTLAASLYFGNVALARQTGLDAVKPVQVAANIYTFDGPMANCVAFAGPEGVLLVDTPESVEMTKAMDAALKTVSDKPVKYLVITHKHFDHVNGNAFYGDQGAKIVAQTTIRKALLTEKPFYSDKLLPAAAAPTICFDSEMTLHLNGEDVWLYHPQTQGAHTGGDTVVYFKKANVIAVGDLCCNGFMMFVDIGDGGWLQGEVTSLNAIISKIDDKTVVIPGHGEMTNKRGLERLAYVYADINARIEAMIKQGKTLGEIKAAHPTAPYDAELSVLKLSFEGKPVVTPPDFFVECVYRGIISHTK